MWYYENDKTPPVITAKKHIESCHGGSLELPKTAILFYMRSGEEYAAANYDTVKISEKFPRFLNSCPVYKFRNYDVCFLDGGRGAPQAADTVETLAALGVKNVVTVGMFGAFGSNINLGDILIPSKALSEEGTSLHYYANNNIFSPDKELFQAATECFKEANSSLIVSTDAVYRQTLFKENLWRSAGAVGVDMETSAVFSVSGYCKIRAVSILIASDKHPENESSEEWKWSMSREMRCGFFEKSIGFVLGLETV